MFFFFFIALFATEFERLTALVEDLRVLRSWSLRRSHQQVQCALHDIIRAFETHDGLVYPTMPMLQFFDQLLALRIKVLRHLKYPAKLSTLNKQLQLLMFGMVSVDTAMMLGLISRTFDCEKLREQSSKDRKVLAKLRKTEKAEHKGEDDDFTSLDKFDMDHSRVRLLNAIVKRYANSSCRAMEKTITQIARKEENRAAKEAWRNLSNRMS